MWIQFDLDGIIFNLKIIYYTENDEISDDEWTLVSANFDFENYQVFTRENVELLMNSEVDYIRDTLEKLLNNTLNETVDYESVDLNIKLIFKPGYDEKTGDVIDDICMELRVYLWGNGHLSNNYFSTTFDRTNIEHLYLYLSLITKKITIDDFRIQKLINNDVIYGSVESINSVFDDEWDDDLDQDDEEDEFYDVSENYAEYKNRINLIFERYVPQNGEEAQERALYIVDESTLTERERMIMILSVIKWEIEHELLTEELKGELVHYYRNIVSGRYKKYIRHEDYSEIMKDITECYNKVFS